MDTCCQFAATQMSVGQDFGFCSVFCEVERLPRLEKSVFEQGSTRDASLLPFFDMECRFVSSLHGVNSFLCEPNVFFLTFDANPVPPQSFCDRAGCAAPKKWIEHHVAG